MVKIAPHNTKVLFENDRVRVLETRTKPGEKLPMHSHPPRVNYFINPLQEQITYEGKPPQEFSWKAGQVAFSEAVNLEVVNIGTTEGRNIVVELKDQRGNEEASSPYAGQQGRALKALSEEDVDAYLTGKGAGMAKVAELNHYPGPAHVLELAAQLKLSARQKELTEALQADMRAEASRLGKALVDKERELDRAFAAGSITSGALDAALREIGALQAAVRGAHLRTHLKQKAILTSEQVARYDELRGYTGNGSGGGGHHHGRHH